MSSHEHKNQGQDPRFALANQLMTLYIGALGTLKEVQEQANIDPVSALPNRRALEAMFARLQARDGHRRVEDAPHTDSFLVIDMDNFSDINTKYGHHGGDKVLRAVGKTLQGHVRSGEDLVARLGGGDELAVVLPHVDMEHAALIAEKLRLETAGETPVTLSIGVTGIRPHETLEDTIARADGALYTAKGRGRNQTILIDPVTFEQQQITPLPS